MSNEVGVAGVGVSATAEVSWQLRVQPRSTWTQELDLRPFKETF